MANNYNSNPIYLDTDMASGWRELQTLNAREFGIRITAAVLSGASAGGNVQITDPQNSTVLLSVPVTASMSPLPLDFESPATWRDFKVTGLTATSSKLQIWYRA